MVNIKNIYSKKLDLEKMKLENNEDQARERIRVAEEKIKLQREKNNVIRKKS